MLQAIFTELSNILTAFVSFLGSGFSSVLGLIYNNSSSNAGLTDFGKVALIGLGVGLCLQLFAWIRGLIQVRAR